MINLPLSEDYKLSFCEELLEELLKTQEQVRLLSGDPDITLIYNAELHEIRRIWRLEKGDWQDRVPRIYKDVTGKILHGLMMTELLSTIMITKC